MPTGYTSAIYNGESPSTRDFILGCARAMGAFVMLRDEPNNIELPQRIEPNEYYGGALTRALERMAELVNMTPEQMAENAEQSYLDAVKGYEGAKEKNDRLYRDYAAMLREVSKWQPPTPEHEGLRDFMVQQIEESIKFDCSDFDAPDCYYKVPVRQTPNEWHSDAIAHAERDLTYSTESFNKEYERAESRNEWIKALFESLPND